jgi:type VI secretion system protein ImpH
MAPIPSTLEASRETRDASRSHERRLALFDALARAPWTFDFFQALRRIESVHADRPRLGKAVRPADEPVRLSQEASVAFASSTLSAFEPDHRGGPRLEQRFFGLLGPNGPLPLHLTEYVRERVRLHRDHTLARFLDLFHHRMALLFYRAWAEARPTVHHDRLDDDRFAVFVGALAGYGSAATRSRDAVSDHAKRFFVGHLARNARNAEGLASILSGYFRVPARIDQFLLDWLVLPRDQRTSLGGQRRVSGMVALGAVVGSRVRDVQSRFRIVLGPLDFERFTDFLPGGRSLAALVDWVRNYVGFEFDWELQLVLARDEVPAIRLGQEGQLGWTAWLGSRPSPSHAGDVTFAPERMRSACPPLPAAA